MNFTVEFYETERGSCPVREFLDQLKARDPDDFAAVIAGLAKLQDRQYHRERYAKRLALDSLSCAMSASSTPACCGFS